MDTSINSPIDKAASITKWVWYSSNAALEQGEAVCYNYNYGTAATREPRRYNEVETPTTLNAQFFAGVSASAYAAKSGGQLIQIFVPGSVCDVRLDKDTSTVVGVGLLTFDVTSGYEGQFRYEGLAGEGSIVPLQSITADGTNTVKCLARLQVGAPSGGVEVVPLVDNDAIGTLMIGGTTLVTGSVIGAGDCTYTLADGAINGLLKKFKVITAEVATSDLVITVTNGRTSALADSALASVTFPDAGTTLNTEITLKWGGGWCFDSATKTLPALA